MAHYVSNIEEYLAQFKRSNFTDLFAIRALIATATELERSLSAGSHDFTPVKIAKKAPPKKKVKPDSSDSSSLSASEDDEAEEEEDSSSDSESEEEKPVKKRFVSPKKKKMAPKKKAVPKAVAKVKKMPFVNNAGSGASSSDSESEEERAPRPKKIKKDPNAPKRNKTAYLFFVDDKRASVRAQYPEWSIVNVIKQMGTMWKEMTDAEKQPYVDKAAQDKIRYDTEMAQYTSKNFTAAQVQDEEKEIEPPSPAEKAKSSVKRPLSAYMLYCQQNREAVKQSRPDATFSELGMLMAQKWKDMSDADKQVYQEQAQKDKERYQREVESTQ